MTPAMCYAIIMLGLMKNKTDQLRARFEAELAAFKSSLEREAKLPESVAHFVKLVELLVWADKNEQRIVDFFIENNLLQYFVILCEKNAQKSNHREIDIALIKLFSFLLLNVSSQELTNLIYSHRVFNNFIRFPFDVEDDEVVVFYVNFAKSVAQRFGAFPLQIFYNRRYLDFPLFTTISKFFSYRDNLVRATTFNTLFTMLKTTEKTRVAELLREFPYNLFFVGFTHYLNERLQLDAAPEVEFNAWHEEAMTLIEYLIEFVGTAQPEFKAMVVNCFFSYTLLPLLAAARDSFSALPGLLLLLDGVQQCELHAQVVDLFLSSYLPRGLLDDLPKLPNLDQVFSPSAHVMKSSFVSAHMLRVYEHFFGTEAEPGSCPALDVTLSSINSGLSDLSPQHLEYFLNVSRGTGVAALMGMDHAVSDAPLDAPLAVLSRQRTQENTILLSVVTLLGAQKQPSLGGLVLLNALLDAARDYTQLKAFCSPAVIARLQLLLALFIRNRASRLALYELFTLLGEMARRVPEVTPSVFEVVVECLRPVFQFFFDYNLSRGLSRLCLLLEEELGYARRPLRVDEARLFGLSFNLLTPTAREKEIYSTLPGDEQGVLRSNVSVFVGSVRVLEKLSAGAPLAFTSMYDEFYAQFPALEHKPDHVYDLGEAELFPIEIKVKEKEATVRKQCHLQLADVNLLIVTNLEDEGRRGNVLINIKYKFFRAERNEKTNIMLNFYTKINGLLLFFPSAEERQRVYGLLKEAQRRVCLQELKLFSSKLQTLKERLQF